MKTTNTTITSTITAETTSNSIATSIADSVYPDISDKSPRQIEDKLLSLRDALEDSVTWNNYGSMIYYQKEIDEWSLLKTRIEERARKEGKT
jgi:hypothetical protein